MTDDNFNRYCEELLVRYKRRDAEFLTKRLENLCGFLRNEGNHVVQTMFGGSVQKGTYVTGLSDVDALLIVNESSLLNQPPSKVKKFVRDAVQMGLPNNSVRVGNLAVTVEYADGTEIQLLPAIRTKSGGIRIARPGNNQWSSIAHPERFAEKLAEVNTARGGRVVPVIKLAKAMAACFIKQKDRKLSGYHMESLAIDAFEDYEGPLYSKSMLAHFLGHSMEAVKRPIIDSTGQSRNVDEYLGPADSSERKRASTYFGQMRGFVNRCTSRAKFNKLFCVGG